MYKLDKKLEDRIFPEPMSGCWIWIGSRTQSGYGKCSYNGKDTTAHRIIYEATIGEIPYGLEIDHLCKNICCVNPDHLEPVTPKENMRRGSWAGKKYCPKGHPYSGDNLHITTIKRRGYIYHGKACMECNRVRAREKYRRSAKEKCTQTINK